MRTTDRSYFKRALVVFMAIIMVFTMMPTGMWGGAETAWADTTVITTPEAFAAMDANGSYELGKDIIITAPYSSAFSGTFDGKGHTVTLAIEGNTNNVGMFSTLAGGATVKNVAIDGSVSGNNNVGGIVGTVESNGNAIRIERCKNNAQITGTKGIGGIIGYGVTTDVYILECANTGNITSTRQGGGIAGNVEGTFTVENCYNTGSVLGTSAVSGILGRGAAGVSVTKCYTTGSLGDTGYAIIGTATSSTPSNVTECYALSGSAGNFCYTSGITKDEASGFKSEDEMKSEGFVTLLGSAFMPKAGDFPALSWETPTASVQFNITPDDAVLTINETTYTGSCSVALPEGEYNYTVSLAGYTEKTGSVAVTDNDGVLNANPESVKVELKKDDEQWTDVHFTVTPADASFELKDGEKVIQPSAEGTRNYSLLKGHSYTYLATADGYEDESGTYSYDTDGEPKTINLLQVTGISLSGNYKTDYIQGDKLDTTGLVVTAKLSDDSEKTITEGYTITGFSSDEVKNNLEVTVSYKGKTASFTVTIGEKLVPSSVFNALKGKATVEYSHSGSYKGEDGKEFIDDENEGALKSNSAGMDSSQVTVMITMKEEVKPSKLYFDYKVSSESSSSYVSDGLQINDEYKIGTTEGFVTHFLTVKGGDKVTLTYTKDYSDAKGDDCIWLKNFRLAELHTLSFVTTGVVGATIEVTDKDGNRVDSANGVYTVEDGTYNYTVSKFGYETITGQVEVSGSDKDVTVTLKELVKKAVIFNITLPENLPEGVSKDCTIEIKSEGTQVASGTEKTYSLPEGEYTYTVSHPNCEIEEGNFTIADADITVNIQMRRKLVFSDVFTGMAGIEASNKINGEETTDYGFMAAKDGEETLLKSDNQGRKSSTAAMTIKAKKAQKIGFSYKVSTSQYYDSFSALKNGAAVIDGKKGVIDWTAYSVNLAAGDILVLKYVKGYYGGGNDDTVYLKNFTAQDLYKLTFTGAPEGAEYAVEQGETVIVPETDGSYLLTDGTYTYTVTAFGYGTVSKDITVNGADVKEPITMTRVNAYKVTFNIEKPEGITADTTVEVKNGSKVISPKEDGTYELPAGDYSYTITCQGCEKETGSFEVNDEGKEVKVVLEKTLTFEDFFTALAGRATVTNDSKYAFKPVKEGTVKYLQSSNITNGTESKITFTVTKPTRVTFAYMVSESGSTYTSSDYGLKISRNGKLIDRYEKVSTQWESYEIVADAGDTVTIGYKCYKNGYAISAEDENFIRLKDFNAVPLTKISFDGAPANAKITINKDGQAVAATDGKFLLEAGNYTYDVKAFGYKDITGRSLTVDGTKDTNTVNLTMVPMESVSVNFKITPASLSNLSIVVKNADGEVMAANEGTALIYSLPKNEKYSYEISAEGYVSKSGYFTADKAKEITANLAEAGDAWDGTTKTEPSQKNGVYQISSAAELAWFADKVKEDVTINGKLTKNINLNNKEWKGFGEYVYNDVNSGFAGTLDGDGKSVVGLTGSSGMIDCLSPTGVIRNLQVHGTINGSGNLGGIANTSKGTIENCMFSGTVANSYSGGSAAGIVGRAMTGNSIRNCVSNAEVSNTSPGINQSMNLGGIAGYSYGTIENCYFTGTVYSNPEKDGNKAIGGLVGELRTDAILKNSYTIGTVTGPAAGIGGVIGINNGTVENTYILKGLVPNAIAENKAQIGADIQEKSAEEMQTGLFAYTLGSDFNQDNPSDGINGGFPVLKWQGGSTPSVPQHEQDVEEALKAIIIKDLKRAEELEQEKQAVDKEVEAEGGIEALRELFEDDTITIEYMYELYGIDLDDDGTLAPDSENKYHVRKEMKLRLPTQSDNGSNISWTSSNPALINPTDGTATLTEAEKEEITLTATATKGEYTKTKTFTFVVWPQNNKNVQILADIKEKAERTSTFIQPLQVYSHTNITQAMQQWIARQEYPTQGVDKEGIKVTFLEPGTQTMPKNDTAYIENDGKINYFTGTAYGYGTQYAIYDGVKFKLEYEGAETEVSVRAHIGWDTAYVEELLSQAMERVTWDTIKGSNTNSAEDKESDGWYRAIVDGKVTGDLTLPYKLDKITYASIKWTADDMDALYVTDNNDGTYNAVLERPAKGEPDNQFTLKGIATFNFWDDYTIEEFTSLNGKQDPAESFKLFDLTVPANDEDQSETITAALEKYPTLLRDFSNKDQTVDTGAVTKDIQMVRPAVLEDEGIMTDRYNQKVTMTSSDTDVLEFNGYHAIIYRPLPGEEAKTVSYTIRILDRRNNALLGEKTFEMTILPLTQKEIDDAAAWMKEICTEEVYWNGIKGENTSKDNITTNLEPFEEILKKDGVPEYVRGAINITFAGIEVDDLPEYDPMRPQPWREFRSSKHSVIACETLQITQPEYNTRVKIDSVFSYGEFSKYWEKFSADERYEDFEQFYKQPVAVVVTVIGTKGIVDPNPQPSTISATVTVDGKGEKGFTTTKNIKVTGLDPDTSTAWDAVSQALQSAGYSHSGVGDYIASVTDPKGITLSDTDDAKTGWLYTVNGKLPNVYMGSYYLTNNAEIVLYYTPDYTKDPNAGAWSGTTDEVKDVTTDTKTGITTAPTEVKVTEKTNAGGTKEKVAEVKISADNQKEILKQAKASKSKEIILNVSKTAVGDATKAEVTLDKSFIDSIVKDTDAKLTVKTPFGDKTYTQDELKTMSAATTGATVTIAVEKAAEEQTVDVKALTAKLTPVARSAKTAKKNVKVTVSLDKQDKEILNQLTEAGYTVKYRFYRSTKKSAGYKSTVTKKTANYTNTSGKKGTKYFYKVQVRVYDANGKLVAKTALKQCKYACRTWSK